MPTRPHRPRQLEWQVFLGAEAIRRQLLTAHQLRSQAWVRLRYGVYADARLTRDHALACQAAMLTVPPGTVLCGASAAYLYGIEHAARFEDPVHVIAPPKTRIGPRQGITVHTGTLDPTETQGQLTTPARTAWDLAVWLDVVPAVVIIDSLLGRRLTSLQELDAIARRHSARRGYQRAKRAFRLADGRAQSPPESQLRVRLVLAGLPDPVPQYPIRLKNGVTLHPDLAWPEYKVAVEYDGHWHAHPDQLHRDRRRLNQLVAEGWIVIHVTSEGLRRDLPKIVREVRTALAARADRTRRSCG